MGMMAKTIVIMMVMIGMMPILRAFEAAPSRINDWYDGQNPNNY